ncbi:General secretion pathway protein K [Desulfonatronospira thiodismutans ASO3-1]|uniref:General secretion pathway protein K n=1 Tax=Desulfonatronospira thiodismutans ASO3-1 TaxID=555779 RepID=D6SK22_9BACT|nr:PilX N-terminal domain-containing pilus assembly protein [Desulfonatronospira thiodismutans]EFI36225.1 General secretion pathway protein K [Desulfonatronospira thiodismutans ASO3-1]
MFTNIYQMEGSFGNAQKGSALIMALLILLVMSIVVMGMATDSDLDLKISRNLQLKNEAFNNAETGIALATEALRHTVSTCWEGDGADEVPEDFFDFSPKYRLTANSSFGDICDLSQGDSVNLRLYYTEDNDKDDLISVVDLSVFYDNPNYKKGVKLLAVNINEENRAEAIIKSTMIAQKAIHSSFNVGIVSESDITINGALDEDFKGSMHANGEVIQTGGGGGGKILGDVTIVKEEHGIYNEDDDSFEKVGAEIIGKKNYGEGFRKQIRKIEEDDLIFWREYAQDHGQYYSEDVTLDNISNDEEFIFVDGDLVISSQADMPRDITVIASGDIDFRGSPKWDDAEDDYDTVTTSVIAGGDITFAGSGEKHAIFWSNGSFTHNGSAKIKGSIVAADKIQNPDVELHGTFEFEHSENIDNAFLPNQICIDQVSWTELS